jgi:hypothetical protein
MLGPKAVHVTILRVCGAVDSLSYYLLFFKHLHSPHKTGTNDEPSWLGPSDGSGLIDTSRQPVSLKNVWG